MSPAIEKIPCSVEILTRNSAQTLERCLESVKDFVEIIVLDGNSTDGTVEIAKRYGAKVVKQYETEEPNVPIKDYSEVRNKGLRLARYDWFMFIDSDEYLSKETVDEIRSIVSDPAPEVYVWWQPRKYVLDGKIIECATTYPNQQIRFYHRDRVTEFQKPIHEKIGLKEGAAIGTLRNFEYVPLGSLAGLRGRWRRYMYVEFEMNKKKAGRRLFRHALRLVLLFGLYSLRYIQNLFGCSGHKMPLSYEWARHQYELKLAALLFRQGIKNILWNFPEK